MYIAMIVMTSIALIAKESIDGVWISWILTDQLIIYYSVFILVGTF